MVMRMSNKKIVLITILLIFAIIAIPTVYHIYQNHNNRLILVVENEFIYQATLCYKESNCKSVVTLKELYEKGYLTEKMTNPISKEYYGEDSSVNLETREVLFTS